MNDHLAGGVNILLVKPHPEIGIVSATSLLLFRSEDGHNGILILGFEQVATKVSKP